MRFNKVITEVQAEIVNGRIPSNKVFSGNNITELPKDSEWRTVLGEILVAIKKAGLESDFKKDMDPLDITGSGKPVGKIKITSDSGKSYVYDVNKKKLFNA